MQTLMNYGLGIAIQKNFKYRFLDKVSLETHYLGFKDNSPTVESIYEQGGGVLSQISFGHQSNYFRISYWQSHQFLSFIGHPIYQSLSEKGAANNQIDREILSFHLFYSKSIHKNIHLGLMGETYIDLLNNDIDYSMGLTLIIKNLFFIKRFKHSAD